MMLMCKNTPVYNIEKEKTLNYNLLPGLMQQKGADNHTFTKWMKYRYSSGTNTIARKLKGITFGQGARMRINRETRALSFNDCYWTKAEDDSICFEEISPYYKPFWDGNEEFTGQAAPTLYVGGALSKEWKQDGKLYKYGDISVELQCIKLCRECGISVERADETDGGIAISNITSPKVMLEQADQSGRIDPDDFDEETLTTINKFFENSLNVSETSRQLYIHRNTLVYRLDKLQKSTGLDLRVFEDAITFKIALMVVQYMKYMETLDY